MQEKRSNPIMRVCEMCGKEYSGAKTRKFCSLKCSAARQINRVELDCLECEKTFDVPVALYANGRRKYCSKECRQVATIRHAQKCRVGMKHSAESRAKMSAALQGKRKGPRAHNWKGGRVTIGGRLYVSPEVLSQEDQDLAIPMRTKVDVSI